jgi:hypothetical protein
MSKENAKHGEHDYAQTGKKYENTEDKGHRATQVEKMKMDYGQDG